MQKRSEAEFKRIIETCLGIEKAGGDVLAYLESEHYVSPRATWYNIQKYELKRTVISDGRPKEMPFPSKYSKEELKELLEKGQADGKSPIQTLRDLGFRNPHQKLRQIMHDEKEEQDTMETQENNGKLTVIAAKGESGEWSLAAGGIIMWRSMEAGGPGGERDSVCLDRKTWEKIMRDLPEVVRMFK